MGNIRARLKKYPLAYACHRLLKKNLIHFMKFRLRFFSGNVKNTELPDIQEANRILNDLRHEPQNAMDFKTCEIDETVDLTIIIPVYNSERFLDACLKSVADQLSEYNVNVICVDDGSNDSSPEILDKYLANDKFIIVHQKNMGHSGARNTALSKRLGKHLMFIDSDDFICEGYIKKMLDSAYRSNADIVQGGFKKCNVDSTVLDTIKCKDAIIDSYDVLETFGGAPWGRVYRTNLWDGICYPTNMMFEDTIVFNLIFRRAKRVVGVSDTYYMYRVYGNNTLDKLQGDPRLLDAVWCVKYVYNVGKRMGLESSEDYYAFFLGQCSKHVYYRIKHFDVRVQEACFVVLCDIINEFRNGRKHFSNSKDMVNCELENAFIEKNFTKWKLCSEILKNTSG